MDYNDQLVYARQILLQYPRLLKEFQGQFPYLCVDEAQDTSHIQHEIIRLLAGERRALFMVGDEDQSIYGFRAACPEALTQFESLYPGARVLYLEQNYRSTRQIVQAADCFIQKNRQRRPKHMKPVRGDGPPLKELAVYDRNKQYRELADLARRCTRETAILYRDNDSALPLIDLLERSGTPYRCRQVDSSFFSHRVVRDICDIIRFAADSSDGEIFMRIYYKLGAGISRSAAQTAVQGSQVVGEPILTYLSGLSTLSPWSRSQCKALSTHLSHLMEERGDRAVYRIVHFMGYGAYLEQRGADQNKAQILEALGASEPNPFCLLKRLEELEQVVRAGSPDQKCPFLLSTIHSSKGLEYDRVILMDVADGLLPKVPVPGPGATTQELADYEEERRLFYVGMTRAKEELWVVRFRRSGLESTFTQALFPQKSVSPTTAPRPVILPSRTSHTQPLQYAERYLPGVQVTHKQFGPGELTLRTGDFITIRFQSGEEKRFSLSTALKMGQLSLNDMP